MSSLKFGCALLRTFTTFRCVRYYKLSSAYQFRLAGINQNSAGFATHTETKEHDPQKMTESEWLQKLTPEQYYICREKGTEEPFSGKYYMHKEEGVYACVCCGTELFSSKSKYDSGTGWPSFYAPVYKDANDESSSNVLSRPDNSLGTVRTEVQCKKCCAHLGHVFPDGPQPTGNRYCINSIALKFMPKKLG